MKNSAVAVGAGGWFEVLLPLAQMVLILVLAAVFAQRLLRSA